MKLTAKEICIFAMTGALMFASKTVMEALPNIHPVTMLICAVTIAFGPKAIWSVAIYAFLIGFYNGFNLWWIPYVYIWLPPYLMALAIPWKKLSKKWAVPVAMVICALHGLMYGALYAPTQALIFGMSFDTMIKWIIVGFPWDILHAVSNFFIGSLAVPLALLMKKIAK